MNLVMIGSFKRANDAAETKDLITKIREHAEKYPIRSHSENPDEIRFSSETLDFLGKVNLWTIGPAELEQFNYDVSIEQRSNTLVLKTDESDVSAFLKLMIEKGAKIEMFSAHDYPDDAPRRGN